MMPFPGSTVILLGGEEGVALPPELTPYRVALERMLIRDFAAVLKNKRQVPSQEIGDCELANEKVDT